MTFSSRPSKSVFGEKQCKRGSHLSTAPVHRARGAGPPLKRSDRGHAAELVDQGGHGSRFPFGGSVRCFLSGDWLKGAQHSSKETDPLEDPLGHDTPQLLLTGSYLSQELEWRVECWGFGVPVIWVGSGPISYSLPRL